MLNPDRVPPEVRPLMPVAEQWGIADDVDRVDTVRAASRDELEKLVTSVDGEAGDAMYDWLAGPAADSETESTTDEYVAFSAMAMAVDLAQQSLRR